MFQTIQKGKRKPLLNFILGIAMIAGSAIPAQALNFGFEFSNFYGNTGGTVTGRILGLQDNTINQAASNVIIDSIPDAFSPLQSVGGPGGVGGGIKLDVLTWPEIFVNNFSVMNGAITSYDVRTASGTGGQGFHLSSTYLDGIGSFAEDIDQDGWFRFEDNSEDLWLDTDLVNFTPLDQSNTSLGNSFSALFISMGPQIEIGPVLSFDFQKFDLVLITDVIYHPVPEPSTILLFGSSLSGLVIWRMRKS